MKNLQKGSTVIILALVVILIIAVIIGARFYSRHNRTAPVINSEIPTVSTTPVIPAVTKPSEPVLPPHATPSPITKVYTDAKFGYTATYPQTRIQSIDKTGKVSLSIPNSNIQPITIVKATDSADTSTGKWGKNVLSYGKIGWVTQVQNEQDGSLYSVATTPFAFTTSGLPIFNGGTHHGFGLSVYVVALSHTKFLIISGGEGLTSTTGYDYSTDPTLQIAMTVTTH